MKKFALLALFVFLGLNPSLASTITAQQGLRHQKHYVSMRPTATRNVLALAVLKHQRKFIVINDLTDDENDDLPGPDELDLHTLYRRPRLVETPKDVDLSDYVSTRLALARARALQKYNEVWTNQT